MVEPLSSLIRQSHSPLLPAFERLAPPPPENLIAAELTARTSAGDVIIDLHGRGGWIARTAISALRRVYACESTALTRLLAEVLLRPPDLRHFDAALATLAAHPRGDVGLREALTEPFASRCPTCKRPIVVDEFIWDADADAPSRKVFRCSFCRLQSRGAQEQRTTPVDAEDAARAREMTLPARTHDLLRARFPRTAADQTLPDELLALYTPRTLLALEAIISRLDSDLRAAPINAALRLGLVHAVLPTSKLNSYPGRVAAVRIQHGHVRAPGERQWRERNPWLVFEEGCRQVRTFVQRVEASTGSFQPRAGDELEALINGTANVVMRTGSAALAENRPAFSPRREEGRGPDPRNRVRLVISQPPLRWTTENLSFAYLSTSLALGLEAAASLPLEWIYGAPPRAAGGREATALRRSLLAVQPVLAADATAVVLLDHASPDGLVAGVLGGVGAGFRLSSALLSEAGDEIGGVLEFSLARPIDSAETEHPELDGLPPADDDGPFELADVERAVQEVAVAVLRARGEPARFERLLGEVLIGLDRLGHLRRLVGTQTFAETEAQVEAEIDHEPAPLVAAEGDGSTAALDDQPLSEYDGSPAWALGSGSATDHVRLFMEIVMAELRRPDHPRLVELEEGRWWLRDPRDLQQARPPLADRIEWAIFGLLSTAQNIDEAAFFDRVARMFRGHDAPDEELVRAVLESYRDPTAPDGQLRPRDDLAGRHAEHGALVGMLVDIGHRLGLRSWAAPREQRRAYRGATVGDLLNEEEQRVYLPLIAAGDPQTLETTDCVWYLRGKATLLFEVEWTAMISEPLLRRGPRIPAADNLVRLLVIPPERSELVRLKLSRSPLLREAIERDNWHILKSHHLRRLHAAEDVNLDALGPLLGLDPEVERQAEQLNLFE